MGAQAMKRLARILQNDYSKVQTILNRRLDTQESAFALFCDGEK